LSGPFGFGRGGGPGGWIILLEPELHIVGQVMVPDLAGWRRERMPVMPETAFVELAPDWACEVISPATGALDRAKKVPHYARAGVRHLWLIDPTPKTLEIFRSDGEAWRLLATHAGDVKVRAEPFDAIELDLSVLWAR
jgi:Uma2 family endonuclease